MHALQRAEQVQACVLCEALLMAISAATVPLRPATHQVGNFGGAAPADSVRGSADQTMAMS